MEANADRLTTCFQNFPLPPCALGEPELPFALYTCILGDPGVDSGGEGKSKRAEKYGTKKSKEQREEPPKRS